MITVGFGGGCHWCTEAVFDAVRGVTRVEQGWLAPASAPDALHEAARVTFDPQEVPLDVLVAVHVHSHAATADHALRHRYRSAVYVPSDAVGAQARAALDRIATELDTPLITTVEPIGPFVPSPPEHRAYYRTDPQRPFCVRHITPKLHRLHARFADWVSAP